VCGRIASEDEGGGASSLVGGGITPVDVGVGILSSEGGCSVEVDFRSLFEISTGYK
jgi:hypothetical protein